MSWHQVEILLIIKCRRDPLPIDSSFAQLAKSFHQSAISNDIRNHYPTRHFLKKHQCLIYPSMLTISIYQYVITVSSNHGALAKHQVKNLFRITQFPSQAVTTHKRIVSKRMQYLYDSSFQPHFLLLQRSPPYDVYQLRCCR